MLRPYWRRMLWRELRASIDDRSPRGNHLHMSRNVSVRLRLAEVWEIDRLSFDKAQTILNEARNYLHDLNWDLAVRRAQESFELYLKSLFRFLQTEYPATHDLKKQIYALTEALKGYQIDNRQVARLVLANSALHLRRSPAFYGDETINVGGLFDQREAELAVSYAELGQFVCTVVRSHVCTRATTYESNLITWRAKIALAPENRTPHGENTA